MSFLDEINKYDPAQIRDQIAAQTSADVERALAATPIRLENFLALLAPAAAPYLEQMAQRAHQLTVQRFGRTIQMYAPLYLSNECSNGCLYCGFNVHNKMPRRTLTYDEMEAEAQVLHDRHFGEEVALLGAADDAQFDQLVRGKSLDLLPLEPDHPAGRLQTGASHQLPALRPADLPRLRRQTRGGRGAAGEMLAAPGTGAR